jgi:hypothetical protein
LAVQTAAVPFSVSSSVLASNTSAISTDKMDYAPGETAHISGRGFTAGETVRVKIHEDPHTPQERGFRYRRGW